VISNKNDASDEIEPSWSVLLIQHFLSLLSGRLNDCYLNGQVLPFFSDVSHSGFGYSYVPIFVLCYIAWFQNACVMSPLLYHKN
jgi:hypothetical protein